jgi:hypothetical protein
MAAHPLTGELPANAADAFFTRLIQRPYAILDTQLVDPLAVATQVLEERQVNENAGGREELDPSSSFPIVPPTLNPTPYWIRSWWTHWLWQRKCSRGGR